MKTVRFASLVNDCGRPEIYLAFADPAKDDPFQRAVKANRVATVHQEAAGHKTDHGETGFHPGPGRQFLVFPRSLRAYKGRVIVGIKYELLKEAEVKGDKRVKKSTRVATSKRPRSEPKGRIRVVRAKREKPKVKKEPTAKIIPFPKQEATDLKKEIRKALKLLEEGKSVGAYTLLKEAIGED